MLLSTPVKDAVYGMELLPESELKPTHTPAQVRALRRIENFESLGLNIAAAMDGDADYSAAQVLEMKKQKLSAAKFTQLELKQKELFLYELQRGIVTDVDLQKYERTRDEVKSVLHAQKKETKQLRESLTQQVTEVSAQCEALRAGVAKLRDEMDGSGAIKIECQDAATAARMNELQETLSRQTDQLQELMKVKEEQEQVVDRLEWTREVTAGMTGPIDVNEDFTTEADRCMQYAGWYSDANKALASLAQFSVTCIDGETTEFKLGEYTLSIAMTEGSSIGDVTITPTLPIQDIVDQRVPNKDIRGLVTDVRMRAEAVSAVRAAAASFSGMTVEATKASFGMTTFTVTSGAKKLEFLAPLVFIVGQVPVQINAISGTMNLAAGAKFDTLVAMLQAFAAA